MTRLSFPRDPETFKLTPEMERRVERRRARERRQEHERARQERERQEAQEKAEKRYLARMQRIPPDQMDTISEIIESHADAFALTIDEILFTRGHARIEAVQDACIWRMRMAGVPMRAISSVMGMCWASVNAAIGRVRANGGQP